MTPVRRKFAGEAEVCRWGGSLPVRTEVCRWVHRDWWWADRCCLHRRRGLHLFASRSDSHIPCFSCNQGRPFRSRCCFNVLKIEPRWSFPHASWESPLLIFHKIQNGQQHNQQQLFCLLQRPNDQQAPQQIIDWNKLAIKCKCRLTVPVAASLCGVVLVPSWIYFLYHCVAFIAKLFYPQPASSTIVSHAILGFHIGPVDFCNGLPSWRHVGICTSRCVSGAQARWSTLCSWNVSWTRLGFERAPKVKRHHQNALRTSARYFGKSAPLRKLLLFGEIAEFHKKIIK